MFQSFLKSPFFEHCIVVELVAKTLSWILYTQTLKSQVDSIVSCDILVFSESHKQ